MSDETRPRIRIDTADGLFADVAALLARGVAAPGHPYRLPVVATVALSGAPTARTVVLRRFAAGARELEFHSDAKAAKMAELAADARVHFVFWDPESQVQARIPAAGAVHQSDAVARAAWGALSEHGRGTYAGFGDFAVVVCRFDALDVLELRRAGNRHANLAWADGAWALA